MHERTLKSVYQSHREDIGDLITRRPLHPMERLNPFLFIIHHGPQVYGRNNRGLPFGPHPHRGFETVTFIVEGSLVHRDSGGHESAVTTGGIQWMTAGRGVEHSETSSGEFRREGGPIEILQLWINLPARLKMTAPGYTGLQREELETFSSGEATVHLIAGEIEGHRGPVESITGITMATIDLPAGARITLPAPRERRVFLYVVRGAVTISGAAVTAYELAGLEDDGDRIELKAGENSLVVFAHAEPLDEPIAAQGPFVMNTREEIAQAIADYHAGKFGAV